MDGTENPSERVLARIEPRERFFEAQRRNRRATWRMGAVCAASAVLMGVPLTLVITPAICAAGLVVAAVISHLSPLPPWMFDRANRLAGVAFGALGAVLEHQHADLRALLIGVIVLIAPGAILSLALWALVLGLFRRGGVGSTLMHLGARPPNPARNKEVQLNDILDEMAIAARLPRVRAMIVEGSMANAAAIGTSIDDAHIVVTEGLLEALSREELEATIADLVASIGNGDLRIAFAIVSIFETCGLILTLINAPFEREARGALWRMARYAMSRGADGEETDALDAMLTRDMDFGGGIDTFFANAGPHQSVPGKILRLVLLPVFLTNMSIQITLWFFSGAVLGPAMALLWRARRYLADASTVQFTRDPDGLVYALAKLNEVGGGPPGGKWASHLFIVSPDHSDRTTARVIMTNPAARQLYQDDPSRQIATELRAEIDAVRRGDPEALARLQALSAQATAERNEDAGETRVGVESRSMQSFHPSMKRRIERLRRMGAHVEIAKNSAGLAKFVIALSLLLGPLMLLAAGLTLVLIAMIILLNLVILVLWIAVIHAALGFMI